jgi:proline iminopeptidase
MLRPLALLLFALSSFNTSDNVTLHYETLGHGDPVVVLSGGPGFAVSYMKPVAAVVARQHQAVMFEQRGTGRSAVADYDSVTFDSAVADLDALREELKVRKLTIVGHSWGGMLAMLYAQAHPDRVERIVLIDSGGLSIEFMSSFGKNLAARATAEDLDAAAYWRDPERRKANPRHAAVEALKAKTPAYFHDRRNGLRFAKQLHDDDYDPRVFSALGRSFDKYDVRDGMKKLDVPVLIIHGRNDPLVAGEELHAGIPGSKLVWIEKSGHFPWLEQPVAFRNAIEPFLRVQRHLVQ